MGKLTERDILTLKDVLKYDRSGYFPEWRPKTVEKLKAMGLVAEGGAGHRITDAGRRALSEGDRHG